MCALQSSRSLSHNPGCTNYVAIHAWPINNIGGEVGLDIELYSIVWTQYVYIRIHAATSNNDPAYTRNLYDCCVCSNWRNAWSDNTQCYTMSHSAHSLQSASPCNIKYTSQPNTCTYIPAQNTLAKHPKPTIRLYLPDTSVIMYMVTATTLKSDSVSLLHCCMGEANKKNCITLHIKWIESTLHCELTT